MVLNFFFGWVGVCVYVKLFIGDDICLWVRIYLGEEERDEFVKVWLLV